MDIGDKNLFVKTGAWFFFFYRIYIQDCSKLNRLNRKLQNRTKLNRNCKKLHLIPMYLGHFQREPHGSVVNNSWLDTFLIIISRIYKGYMAISVITLNNYI